MSGKPGAFVLAEDDQMPDGEDERDREAMIADIMRLFDVSREEAEDALARSSLPRR